MFITEDYLVLIFILYGIFFRRWAWRKERIWSATVWRSRETISCSLVWQTF
jgi:hypothetical protein